MLLGIVQDEHATSAQGFPKSFCALFRAQASGVQLVTMLIYDLAVFRTSSVISPGQGRGRSF